jgi:glycosyltransferase involved in cell wall biosynthesis
MHRPHDLEAEIAWVRAQGPYSTPLLEAISAAEPRSDAFIFFTYLYATTFFGLPRVAHKAILVPTAHDEPFIYLEAFRELLRRPAAIVYNTHAERDLVQRVAHNAHVPHITAGSGVNIPDDVDPDRFRTRHNIRDPFLLYVGRITPAKNVPELLDVFIEYRRRDNRPLKLLLLGRATMPLPFHPDVIPLGFVSEEEKFDAIAAAEAVVIPSRYESLSLIALEAWLAGTPVLVNGECAVLRQQVRRSNGGLYYSNGEEFARVLNRMRGDAHLRLMLGAQGRHFARHHYGWDVILARYRALLNTLF